MATYVGFLFTDWFFFPFVFGATSDGCVYNSSKVNAAGKKHSPAHKPLLRSCFIWPWAFLTQYTPSLYSREQICFCWDRGSWRMKHPRSQSCAHCCYAKKGNFPDKLLKLRSLSLVLCLGHGPLGQKRSQDQIIWSWGSGHDRVNVNRLKSRKQEDLKEWEGQIPTYRGKLETRFSCKTYLCLKCSDSSFPATITRL